MFFYILLQESYIPQQVTIEGVGIKTRVIGMAASYGHGLCGNALRSIEDTKAGMEGVACPW